MAKLTLPPLPWSPSTNTYYRHVGHSVLISATGRQYRSAVVNELFRAFGPNPKGFPLTGPLKLTALFHRPDLRRRDIDNLLKSLFDSIKHAGIYEDDSQIEHIDVRFAPLPLTANRGTVDITITPIKVSKTVAQKGIAG